MATNRDQESPTEPVSPQTASDAPGSTAAANQGSDGTLQAECERLRRRVQQLELECGGYHRALTALLREHCAQTDTTSDADLDRLAEEALRLEDFKEPLRQLLQEF